MNFAAEALGWIGAGLVLGAYLLVTTRTLSGQSGAFQLMNLFGAVGLTINGVWHDAWALVALDGAWATIAIVALIQMVVKPGAV